MKSIDALINANDAIEENLSMGLDIGKLSQNILSHIRNLVDAVFFLLYEKVHNLAIDYEWTNLVKANEFCHKKAEYRQIYKFYEMLQISTSHYTLDSGNSERIMLKYLEKLLELKNYVKANLDIEILKNLHLFPKSQDRTFDEYYSNIANKILMFSKDNYFNNFDDRFYVEKVKPFFVNEQIFYEVTLSPCRDKRSKFDRIIVFSKFRITANYAIKVGLIDQVISVTGLQIPIKIVINWMVSIRPCEITHFADLIGIKSTIKSDTKEFYETMVYLTNNHFTLYDIVSFSDAEYKKIFDEIHSGKKGSVTFFDFLNECREAINKNKHGSNIVRYFLSFLQNQVIKAQQSNEQNPKLSNLRLSFGCIPFDEMPYCTSLNNHNPRVADLLDCIPIKGRECELLARKIKNNTEQEAMLYTSLTDTKEFGDTNTLADHFNRKLFFKHQGRRLEIQRKHIYISEYESDTIFILKRIIEMSKVGIDQYQKTIEYWLNNYKEIDDESKKEILKKMFGGSLVAAIYGSAGTGKTTLINHVANFFKGNRKLFLANTNTAVDNLRKKVDAPNCFFKTITKHNYYPSDTDLLIIDESSTISNSDMVKVLAITKFKLLIVVGDVYQIESISFGNWFGLLRKFIPNSSYELNIPYRTKDKNLLKLWELVRNNKDAMIEHLSRNGYCEEPNSSIFERNEKDEIVLCLNYDGLYGVNNINRLLQLKNPNKAYEWGIWNYKIDDPIIFNEIERFPNCIHNNLKGIIKGIEPFDNKIYFEIEIEKPINSFNLDYGLKLISTEHGKSVIGFYVEKMSTSDSDNSYSAYDVVPFQISYAISIHKAQGLEYDSVKLVITSEVDENITHNIFYTAITRARKLLKIYWSPLTQNKILESFVLRDYNKEYGMIKNKI